MGRPASPHSAGRRRTSRNVCLLVFLLLVLLRATPSYSYLKDGYRKIIQVAFINGFVAAVKLDPGVLQSARKDDALLRRKAGEAAERYLKKVSEMNP